MEIINYFFKKNIIVVLIMLVIVIANFNIKRWKTKSVIKWDVTSYYAYLPTIFIQKDIKLNFFEEKETFYNENHMYFPVKADNGNHVIKTTMGISILYAPFFGLAYLEALILGEELSGFSTTFHKWIHLSALFYFFFGLYYMNKFLSQKFNTISSAVTLVLIVFGSNLFYYSTTEASMAHVYIFSLLGIFIYYFDLWYTNPNYKMSLLLGLLLGLLVLIRPTNVFVLLFPLFYNVKNINNVWGNINKYLKQNIKHLLIIATISILIVLPQLLYWKMMTGQWVFNSYVGEQFYFYQPHILDMFFSFRKGWLLYSPILGFAIMGFILLYKNHKDLFWSSFLPFTFLSYIFSCWWCWWYGGAFGLRTMIDLYAYLTIPLAGFVLFILKHNKFVRNLTFSIFIIFISFNFFQTMQYRKNIIHWDSMSKEAYFKTFGKTTYEEKFKQHYKTPDYYKARIGGVEYE